MLNTLQSVYGILFHFFTNVRISQLKNTVSNRSMKQGKNTAKKKWNKIKKRQKEKRQLVWFQEKGGLAYVLDREKEEVDGDDKAFAKNQENLNGK